MTSRWREGWGANLVDLLIVNWCVIRYSVNSIFSNGNRLHVKTFKNVFNINDNIFVMILSHHRVAYGKKRFFQNSKCGGECIGHFYQVVRESKSIFEFKTKLKFVRKGFKKNE